MHQYDEDYRTLISQLNGAFHQKKNDKMLNPAVFENLTQEKKQFVKALPKEEIQKIGAKVHSPVTDICFLSEQEAELIEEVKAGRKCSYKQVAFRLVGNIHIEEIMKRYARNIWEEPAFRSVYLYEGLETPVKVVCETREKTFPIRDIREISKEKQDALIKSVMAAEMRYQYDMESDFIFRIQGYLVSDREMTIIISIYPHIPYPGGMNGLLLKVLKGISSHISDVPVVDESVLEKMNEKMWKESVNYWEEFMTPFPKSMTIPGESGQNGEVAERIFGKVLMCKELEMDFSNQIRQFCETHEISLKAMFVYAWGSLLGRYHDEAQPFVAVAQGGTKAEMFPVRVTRDEDWEKAIRDTEEQLVQSPKYCNCTVQDMESAAGVDFSEYFRMIHNFVEFHELDNMGADRNAIRAMKGIHAEDTDINLFISYCLYEKNIVMHYTSKGGIMETILHNLHELFLDELRLILDGNPVGFDKTKFISAADSNEEKMYKIQLAQVGLYLKESGVFDGLSVDEIMKLAEYCEYATYLSNDAVVTEESAVSKVYIVGDGKLEESLTAADGMVKSIRILKKGDVFGLESLYRDSRGTHTITAVTQQVKIVAIDKEILTEVLRRKPEGWIALLEKESTVKSRFQYLWTLE